MSPIRLPDDFDFDMDWAELIPESVARENKVAVLRGSHDSLIVAAVLPFDREVIEKLQFILNRPIAIIPVERVWLERYIDEIYG